MPNQTPEQRDAALDLADELRSVAIDSRLDMKPICLTMDGANAIRNLHAENVRLREALKDAPHANSCWSHRGTVGVAPPCDCWKSRAALSGSPATED